jgi:hypothetical protein
MMRRGLRVLAVPIALALVPQMASAQSILFAHVGESAEIGLGFKLRALADLDGDGVRDYFIGSRLTAVGAVRSGAKGTVIYTYSYPGTCWGMSCTDMGDVNGDGIGDFAVGAPRDVDPVTGAIGSMFMHSGADGSVLFKVFGSEVNGRFGLHMDAIGDVNADGITDLVVTDIWASSIALHGGSATLVSGIDGAKLHTVFGTNFNDLFGYGVSAAGDVDLDGIPDYIIGAPREFQVLGQPAGYVRVFSGATGAQLAQYSGTQNNDNFGLSVAGMTDLTGDGVPELAIGAPGFITGGSKRGLIKLIDGATGATLQTHIGQTNSQLGSYLRRMGDWDGDGLPELLSGACFGIAKIQDTFPGNGYVQVLSSATGAELMKVSGESLTRFGRSVDCIGDITGDGVPDILVGAPETDQLGPGTGTAFVDSGARLPLTADIHEASYVRAVMQNFTLDAGAAFAGDPYALIGSVSGSSPGITLGGGFHIPLNDDFFFAFTLANANLPVFANFAGTLDGTGLATAQFFAPAGSLPPVAVGLTMHFAYVVKHAGHFALASNPVPLTFLP